jgi:hypothetical protein
MLAGGNSPIHRLETHRKESEPQPTNPSPLPGKGGKSGQVLPCPYGETLWILCWLLAACFLACLQVPSQGFGQQEGMGPRSKIPVINKISTTGPTRSAFTGSVQSLDGKLKILDVSGAHGRNTAIFPLNKKTKISSINGQKLKLAALTPGTNVIVYYEQSAARRTVQQIIVLGSGASPTKKNVPSS